MTRIPDARSPTIAPHGFEQSELAVARDHLRAAEAEVHGSTPDGTGVKGWDGDAWAHMADADLRTGAIATAEPRHHAA